MSRRFRIKAGVIFGGESIDKSAHSFHLFRQALRAPGFGSLKQKVLKKVRDTAVFFGFVTSAYRDPDTYADALHLRHLAGRYPNPVPELCCLIYHCLDLRA
jgi:hypothetical protein